MHRLFAICSWLPLMLPLMEEPGGGAGGGGGKKKTLADVVKEIPELQDEIDDAIERRLARERRRNSGEGGTSKEEREELERLRQERADREREDATKKGEFEKALNLEKERWGQKETGYKTQTETLTRELRQERVRGKLVAAAAKHGAIDPEEIADLLENRVDLDEKFKPRVLDERDRTKPAINSAGDDMTIDELVEGFLSKKKHLAKAADGDGAGAKGGRSTDGEGAARGGGAKKDSQDLAELKAAYEDAHAQAQKSPTPAHLTRMQQAKKRYEAAKKAAA